MQEQQFEFATAVSTRIGASALLKPLSALLPALRGAQVGKPVGQVRISLRNVSAPGSWDRQVVVGHGRVELWLCIPIANPLNTGKADRASSCRSHPDEMQAIFGSAEDAAAVRSACLSALDTMLDTPQPARSGDHRGHKRAGTTIIATLKS